MNRDSNQKRIVLIGGGHAHLQVIKAFNQKSRPKDWSVTLIDQNLCASYSGMVPGCVSKLYSKEDTQISLEDLAQWANVDFIKGTMVGISNDASANFSDMNKPESKHEANGNHEAQQIFLEDGSAVEYDVLSLDIGSTCKGLDIPGVLEHCIPTRPIDALVNRIQQAEVELLKKGREDAKVVVVGGGAAGIELAMGMRARFDPLVDDLTVTILDSGTELFTSESVPCKDALKNVLEEKKVDVRYECRVQRIGKNVIILEDGTEIPCTHCIWATGASAHLLSTQLEKSGLAVSNDGWIEVGRTLQSISHDNIFAAGDCATIVGLEDPVTEMSKDSPPKAGVYAVRSGPILIENISRYINKEKTIEYVPQDDFLKLIMCGDRTALGFRFGLPLRGKWVWELKDTIDQMFMDIFKLENLPNLTNEKEGELDTSEYDQYAQKSDRLTAKEGAELILRTDDDVDFQQAWNVLREMMADDEYKKNVLSYASNELFVLS